MYEGFEDIVHLKNLQNIPSHIKDIRMLFQAADGCILVGSDYSLLEVGCSKTLLNGELLQRQSRAKYSYS